MKIMKQSKKLILPIVAILSAALIYGCDDDNTTIVDARRVPAIPTGVYSVTGDGVVSIIWPENNDGGITKGYGVYYFAGYDGNREVYELMATVDASERFRFSDFDDQWFLEYDDYDVENSETYFYAVNAYNDYGESELSIADVFDTPRPQGSGTANLNGQDLNRLGWDFSSRQLRDWDDNRSDIFFEWDSQIGAFFIWAGNGDGYNVYIQDYGTTGDITAVGWGEVGGGWSEVGWLELIEDHSYIIRMGDINSQTGTADGYYATVRVTDLNSSQLRVSFQWAYQEDYGNPELKRVPKRSADDPKITSPIPSRTVKIRRAN